MQSNRIRQFIEEFDKEFCSDGSSDDVREKITPIEVKKFFVDFIEKIEVEIIDEIGAARREHAETSKLGHNSYGAGEAFGTIQGLRKSRAIIRDEEFEY